MKSLFLKLFFLFFITLFSFNFVNAGYGLNNTAQHIGAFDSQVSEQQDNFLQTRTGQIIGFVLSFVGVLFLILMIYSGLTWMTAGGNKEKVTKAKDLMINAIIGLIVVMGAYAITAFIGSQLI